MNTQQLIDLNASKAAQELHQLDQHQYAVEHKSVGHNTISDDSAIIPITKKSKYVKQYNSRRNSTFTIDDELSNQEIEAIIEDLELTTQDQDPDLIAFKEMCEQMSKIQQGHKPKSPAVQINSMKQINIQQVNVICCEDQAKQVPNTSKANSLTNLNSLKNNNTSKVPSNKKVKCETQTKSSENLNKLSHEHQHKKFKDNTSNNILETNSKSRSDNIVAKFSFSKKIRLVITSSSEDEEYSVQNNKRKKTLTIDKIDSLKQNKCKNVHSSFCETINEDVQLKTNPKLQLGTIVNNYDASNKHELIVSSSTEDEEYYLPAKNVKSSIVTSVEIRYSRKFEPIFCCSPYGKIHKDMLNQINNKK